MYRCLKQPLKLVPTLIKDPHIHRENSSECFLRNIFQNAKKRNYFNNLPTCVGKIASRRNRLKMTRNQIKAVLFMFSILLMV